MTRRYWTVAEVAVLREFYPNERGQDVAKRLGRTLSSVFQRARAEGLEKSAAFLASDLAGRIQRGKQSPAMIATRIQPGSTPWNKGVKGSTGTQEGCRATQFKAGRKPEESANYQPIGSLRVSRDGYLERKVTDDQNIYPARRWVPVHRTVWEAANGPIPAGHIVVYRPGMKTLVEAEITADRLECITRAENAHRNHPRNRDPELGRLVQLKGAITRQVNRINREAQERNAV